MKKSYHKLVRDRIPEIIAADSEKPVTRILGEEEFKQELLKKLVEEAKETEGTKGERKELIKELGDVLEVIEAVLRAFGLDKVEIEKIKKERKDKRGGFDKRIYLEHTE